MQMNMNCNTTSTARRNGGIFLAVVCVIMVLGTACSGYIQPSSVTPSLPSFIAAIDTMKVSRDTQQRQLSKREIMTIVNLSASLHTNYITVDTNWDYPAYIQKWVDAVRAVNLHVWFRSHPNQWENTEGTTGIMTPEVYKVAEQTFIEKHPKLFQSGDIFDPCPEPEQGLYWQSTYDDNWTSHAPNDATREFNAFIRDTSDVADKAFQQIGIYGIITSIRSTNSFFSTHPDVLEKATVDKFQRITVDSYPDAFTTNPVTAVQARIQELQTIENTWHVPIVIGEMGYSNKIEVDDETQHQVLKAELDAISAFPYISGINYWVGAGSNTAGGYTYIITKNSGEWSLRPAAYDLLAFYKSKLT